MVKENYEIEEVKIENPYGSYRVTSADGEGIVGSLRTEEEREMIIQNFRENPNADIDLYISRYINGIIDVEKINLK